MEFNGRMRDFYDVYLIYTKDWNNINVDSFKNAIDKTFSKRDYLGNPFTALNIIRNSKLLRVRWKNYQNKYIYANNIDFNDIIDCIEEMIKQSNYVVL